MAIVSSAVRKRRIEDKLPSHEESLEAKREKNLEAERGDRLNSKASGKFAAPSQQG
jgi:hypothetical protein